MSSNIQLSQVYFIITRTCNLFCSHCIRSSGPKVRDQLSLDQAKYALSELHRLNQNPMILISGGEPTLHKNFYEIVEHATKFFETVMINTNGLNYNALGKVIKAFPNVRLQISVDGDASTHNLIRGKNTFEQTMENIQRLSDEGAYIVVAATVGKSNLNSMSVLDKELSTISFIKWTIQREVLYGRASSANMISTNQWNEFVDSTNMFINNERLQSSKMFALSSFASTDVPFNEAKCNCGTGHSKVYINPDLTFFPCACLEEFIIGDLKQDSMEEVLKSLSGFNITSNEESPCRKCPVFSRCKGGCPGASYHTYGQFGVGDPRCPAIQTLVGEEFVK